MSRLTLLTGAAIALLAVAVQAATVVIPRGVNSLQANLTTKIDVTDPDNNAVIDTGVWSITTSGGGSTGTFATSGNNGEMWTKVFDNAAVGGGPWGSGTSKVCCGGIPAIVTMQSKVADWNFTGYTLTLSNDSPNRDPKGWTFEGWNGSIWVVLDTQSNQFVADPGRGFTTEYLLDGSAPNSFTGFRFQFTSNRPGDLNQFALAEIEVFGAVPEPMTMVLAGMAVTSIGAYVRRRRSAC